MQNALHKRLIFQSLSRSSFFDLLEVSAVYPDVHLCLLGTDTLLCSVMDLLLIVWDSKEKRVHGDHHDLVGFFLDHRYDLFDGVNIALP